MLNTLSSPLMPAFFSRNMTLSNADLAVLGLTVAVGGLYVFRGNLFNGGSGSSSRPLPGTKPTTAADPGVDPRDFVAKMKAAVSIEFYVPVIFLLFGGDLAPLQSHVASFMLRLVLSDNGI